MPAQLRCVMFSSLRSRVLTLQEIPDSGHLGGERAPTLLVSLSDPLPSIKQLNFFKALHKPSAAATNVSVSATDQVSRLLTSTSPDYVFCTCPQSTPLFHSFPTAIFATTHTTISLKRVSGDLSTRAEPQTNHHVTQPTRYVWHWPHVVHVADS